MLRTAFKVPETSLRTKDEEAPHGHIANNRGRTQEPDERVTEKIDLAMIFYPEVL
jgi:hypothetical protein